MLVLAALSVFLVSTTFMAFTSSGWESVLPLYLFLHAKLRTRTRWFVLSFFLLQSFINVSSL